MHMPKPMPEHLRLEVMAGDWEGEEKMYASQWDPQGGIATGRTRSRLALGGFALITDYEQERDGAITFSGHGVMAFDASAERYVLHWFDCMGSPAEVFTGSFEGDVLQVAHGGPGMHARLTYDLGAPGRMVTRMAMSSDGAAWNTLFEGVYVRL